MTDTPTLPGYTWSKTRKRFISLRTGKPISDAELQRLFRQHIEDAEDRMGAIATAYHDGKLAPAVFVEQMATEQRRHTIQSAALGSGGFDEMDAALLIALALLLRGVDQKIVGTAHDVLEGKVSLPQLHNRVEGYVGEGRRAFFEAMRGNLMAMVNPGMTRIERRVLHAKRSCADCVRYHDLGWQIAGTILPVPSVACQCASHCRCEMLHMSVPSGDVQLWIGTKR